MQDALGQDYTFIDLTGSSDTRAVEAEFARLGAPLEILRIDDANVRAAYECPLLLVRPDLHVFWRGEILPDDVDRWAEQAVGHLTQAERDAKAREDVASSGS